MKRTTFYIMILVFAAIQVEIAFGETAKPLPDGKPTYQEFEAKIKKYPYVATAERSSKILAGLTKLESCMNKASIETLLGAPDYSEMNYGPKGPGEKWLGSSWVYFLSKRSRLVNENDPCVQVFFNTADRAHWIVPRNINGFTEIGKVKDNCTQPVIPADR